MAELKYFKKFGTKSEYNTYIDGTPVLPNVSIVNDEDVYFTGEGGPSHDYSQDYLTIVMLTNGKVNTSRDVLEYSIDGGETWQEYAPENLQKGDKLMLRGSFTYGDSSPALSIEGNYNAQGNLLSIYDKTGFRTRTVLDNTEDNFQGLFWQCSGLISAKNLILPLETLTPYCYNYMFKGCTSLTSAPELPATTLTESCYGNMFAGCTSLTSAPVLPTTTLADYCYSNMFWDCTGLTSAPALPATTLADGCYEGMFYGCTNLNYIKCLATDISADDCTTDWINGVSSTGTFVKNPGITENEWGRGNSGIPTNWSVQDA